DQLEVLCGWLALYRHVSDAGGEGTAYSEDLLVDDIAHAVRCIAHRAGSTGEALPGEPRSGERVHELEVDGEAAVIQRRGAPDHDVVTPHRLPRGARHFGGAARRCGHALARQGAEASAAFEVVLHDVGDVELASRSLAVAEGHDRDRHRVLHPGGDLDLQFGTCRGHDPPEARDHSDRAPEEAWPAAEVTTVRFAHEPQSGLKSMRRCRSKSAGSGGGGSSEARYTAPSIDTRSA